MSDTRLLVELEYFKDSGKFYTEGSYSTEKIHAFEIFDEVKQLQRDGRLPGLAEGAGKDLLIRVNIAELYPALIRPLKGELS